jgi:hypothetical protein
MAVELGEPDLSILPAEADLSTRDRAADTRAIRDNDRTTHRRSSSVIVIDLSSMDVSSPPSVFRVLQ